MSRLGRNFRRGGAKQPTAIQRALAVLRKFGTDAHIWLPGVGSINGLTAANYLLSDASTGLAPVDQYVGLASDALGGLGVELVTNAWGSLADWTYSGSLVSKVGTTAGGGPIQSAPTAFVTGKSYRVEYEILSVSGGSFGIQFNGGTSAQTEYKQAVGKYSSVLVALAGNIAIRVVANTAGAAGVVTNISVREVTGIHLVQGTTANKPQLKLVGNSHRWVFDATDLLTCTMPAGYETATTIDAKPTGQVTLQGQNIVGAYSIGPNLTTSGRIVLKYAPSASDLVLLQNLANRLAGL